MASVSMRLQVHVFLMQFMWSRCEFAVVNLDESSSTITEMRMPSFMGILFIMSCAISFVIGFVFGWKFRTLSEPDVKETKEDKLDEDKRSDSDVKPLSKDLKKAINSRDANVVRQFTINSLRQQVSKMNGDTSGSKEDLVSRLVQMRELERNKTH
eukprot:4971912-Pyramimonas_sp.AAC.2